MKVILLEDVKELGKKNDVVEIKDNYARNFIIPKKKGVEATPKAMNDLKLRLANEEKNALERLNKAKELAAKIEEGGSVKIRMKVGGDDRLFGAVTSKEIAQAVKDQLGYEVDKKKIMLPEAIKKLGAYDVNVKLHPQVQARMKVTVEGE